MCLLFALSHGDFLLSTEHGDFEDDGLAAKGLFPFILLTGKWQE